ncbi:MAG: RDD family protein [Treponema sp.]|nr:RDD family protein [Treponema sp.]MCL2237334.1 RDD family protein [Treponema sp.]
MSNRINTSLDPSIKAITPEGVEFVLSPAGLPVRTIAYAIDKLIQWAILLFMYIMYELLNFSFGFWIFFIVMFCVNWLYHIIFELAFKGQSIGKRTMGLRVVKNDGSPVDPASSFIRNLLRFADSFLLLFPIAYICIASSKGFRRIGDWAGGTLVVYSSLAKNRINNSLSRTLENFEPVTPPRTVSQNEKQLILNFARRYSLLGEARANEIAKIYAPSAAYLMGIARKLSGEI